MATIKIRKVTTIPVTPDPNTLYFIKDGTSKLIVYMTNSVGDAIYRTTADGDIGPIVNLIINSIKDQPNGLAGLDSNGELTVPINGIATGIEAQDVDLKAGNTLAWKTITNPVIFKVGRSSSYGYARTYKNNIKAIAFRDGRTNRFDTNFVLPHDYAEGTDVKIKMHISPDHETRTGDSIWRLTGLKADSNIDDLYVDLPDIDYTIAMLAGTRYRRIAVPLQTMDGTDLKIGTDLKFSMIRRGGVSADTYNDYIFALDIELSYQITRFGTKNSEPDYFT